MRARNRTSGPSGPSGVTYLDPSRRKGIPALALKPKRDFARFFALDDSEEPQNLADE